LRNWIGQQLKEGPLRKKRGFLEKKEEKKGGSIQEKKSNRGETKTNLVQELIVISMKKAS